MDKKIEYLILISILFCISLGTSLAIQTGFTENRSSEDDEFITSEHNGLGYQQDGDFIEPENEIEVKMAEPDRPPTYILLNEIPNNCLPVSVIEKPVHIYNPEKPYPLPPILYPPINDDIIWITPSED
ncbi:hypothetical protein AYK24_08445 [Thermoplasmatales archaeon SG8-52-4]|nr:MAG: hypothetical protein AYK24_08445 [Thermoplasmatales archaeon SG8-52-4]